MSFQKEARKAAELPKEKPSAFVQRVHAMAQDITKACRYQLMKGYKKVPVSG